MTKIETRPQNLTDFVTHWCADLIDPLSAAERAMLINMIHIEYAGRPWPSRLAVQRMVEVSRGEVAPEAAAAEQLAMEGGIERLVLDLARGEHRDEAIAQLGAMQPTGELVRAVLKARDQGWISIAEKDDILTRSLRQPMLPEPIADPLGRAALPPGYPLGPDAVRQVVYRFPVSHSVPALAHYVPQRPEAELLALPEDFDGQKIEGAWMPMRSINYVDADHAEPGEGFCDLADAFLRARGWHSRRDLDRGHCENDEWTWPRSEDDPWWQPTIIDLYDGQFRVRLASASLVEPPRSATFATLHELRQEIGPIEQWADQNPGPLD